MTRRDIIQEVAARRIREANSSRLLAFIERHKAIETAFKLLLDLCDPDSYAVDPELSRYFPTALIAAIEGYYRQCISDLVNAGSPFTERAAKLKDISLSVPVVSAIQDQRITLGDYVSHFISIGSLEDINRALSTLLDLDFLETFLTSQFNIFGEEEGPLHLLEVRAEVVSAATELFRTRHLLCHEFAKDKTLDNAEIHRMLLVADLLVALSDVIVTTELQIVDREYGNKV